MKATRVTVGLLAALMLPVVALAQDTDPPETRDEDATQEPEPAGPAAPAAPEPLDFPTVPGTRPPPREVLDEPEVVGEEVVVYGEALAAQARKRVEEDLVGQGFDRVIEKDGYTLFRHDATWKGEVRVYDDGWIRLKRQPVQFRPPAGSPLGWATCVVVPLCVRSRGQTVSRAKMMGQRRRTLGQVEPLARQWGDRVADVHTDEIIVELPERLDALWAEGTPLHPGDPPLATPELRKQAMLDYWDSRTDTVWGRRVKAVVEAYLREVVQHSPFPLTHAELGAFQARRHSTDPLDLERPWEDVLADLEERAGD